MLIGQMLVDRHRTEVVEDMVRLSVADCLTQQA